MSSPVEFDTNLGPFRFANPTPEQLDALTTLGFTTRPATEEN
jgi:hypothetical protein